MGGRYRNNTEKKKERTWVIKTRREQVGDGGRKEMERLRMYVVGKDRNNIEKKKGKVLVNKDKT